MLHRWNWVTRWCCVVNESSQVKCSSEKESRALQTFRGRVVGNLGSSRTWLGAFHRHRMLSKRQTLVWLIKDKGHFSWSILPSTSSTRTPKTLCCPKRGDNRIILMILISIHLVKIIGREFKVRGGSWVCRWMGKERSGGGNGTVDEVLVNWKKWPSSV